MRALWLIAGLMSFTLGLVGAFLPLLPTVPLMLLATFCFSKSSERLHSWLINHPRFGPAISDWNDHGAISPLAKKLATISIAAAFTVSLILGVKTFVIVIQAIVLGGVLVFIWTRPNS
ncbi:YbaN family protein [Halocynthiibacter namhaensis]|uniref:YbaN family protein n=1 Tax=Halocynthiibacter namhaensis TaxID=1290553 RepID=UPI0005798604|nr:YbaN family protein [Halocynthiibacter namhaensis]